MMYAVSDCAETKCSLACLVSHGSSEGILGHASEAPRLRFIGATQAATFTNSRSQPTELADTIRGLVSCYRAQRRMYNGYEKPPNLESHVG
jgi:hypothetical protein